MPATRVAGAADLSPAKPAPAVTPSGKSKIPLIAAVATVVVLGGGTALMMQMKKPPAPANPPASVTHGAADSSRATQGGGVQTPTTARGANGQPKGTEELRKQEAKQPPVTTAGTTKAPAVDVDAELKRLDALEGEASFDAQAAHGVLTAMDKLPGNLTTAQQVLAAMIRAVAQGTLGHADLACDILSGVKSKALSTSYASRFTEAYTLAQCK